MITITKERLLTIKQWRETYGPGSNVVLPAEEAEELARIALASLEAEPVSQTYKLPVNTPCQDAPAHIWLQTAGVWPDDGELSELTWCSHNQHHDDTLYVRADLVNGNSPVTPDGWISCSDRMPNDKQYVWCWVSLTAGLSAIPSKGITIGRETNGGQLLTTEKNRHRK